ncbi:uncharacterized protein LOC125037919 [Penaeus chinensis]|uniref:uncharacterized protein LOC125037919 n=1 Tax=Penaeus chinensis TaxID=139456 RepID=UPI001FB79DB0|nr:uncharacterized protein LOC125037919 [Penaeus chinensis]
MKLLVLVLVAAVSAIPEGYKLPRPSNPFFIPGDCSDGQVLHVDGRCVTPQVVKRVFVYDVPLNVADVKKPQYIPEPKVERNMIFVRLPDDSVGPEPIVVPPPRQQHVIYVLNKQLEQDQRVIEIPAPPPSDPEVFFVNYAEGENPTLPGGGDLQTALGSAVQGTGEIVSNGAVSGIAGGTEETEGASGNIGSGIGVGIGGGTEGNIGGDVGSSVGSDIGGDSIFGISETGNIFNGKPLIESGYSYTLWHKGLYQYQFPKKPTR